MKKSELGRYYNTTPLLSIENFIELLLATLAINSRTISFKKTDDVYADLPSNYLLIIEDILFQENGWAIRFSSLLDIENYFKNQQEFEILLASTIANYTKDKKIQYDFLLNNIRIPFKKQEIQKITEKHDSETLEKMDHFSRLIQHFYITNRIKKETKQHRKMIST